MNDAGTDIAAIVAHLSDAASPGEPTPPARGTAPVGVPELGITGPRTVLPSPFDVTGLATAAVASALQAIAGLHSVRHAGHHEVTVDTRDACADFLSERLFTPVGWEQPPLWDPLSGNYRTRDGWIRLHTNYPHHRAAVVAALGTEDPALLAEAVARDSGESIENAVVAAGGAAARMQSREEWLASEAGRAVRSRPLLDVVEAPESRTAAWQHGSGPSRSGGPSRTDPPLPLDGIRVLDLTRVIAGPVCTNVLAAHGAEVLRIDPPGFPEVASLPPVTTPGKRSSFLDIAHAPGAFAALLASADVLVCGLRPGALAGLGFDAARLRELNPDLIVAELDAYGWTGPWATRRGFDSLVQMSCGITARGAEAAGSEVPVPLPAQALDHGTGWLLAAAVACALTRRITQGTVTHVRAALASTAEFLWSLPSPGEGPPLDPASVRLEDVTTAWGPARAVPLPGRIAGVVPVRRIDAGPLGRHAPAWS